jgi:hypothetical protein
MNTARWLTAGFVAVLLSSCSAAPSRDTDLIGKIYEAYPTSCFAGLEQALADITGKLYNQRKPPRLPPSTLPMRCEAEFVAQDTEPGPAERVIQGYYWLFRGTGTDRSDVEAAQRLYNSTRDKVPESDRAPLPDNANGFSWKPGHSAVLDGNLFVQFTVTGKDRAGTLTDMPPTTARDNAAILATTQLRNCSPVARC